MKRLLLLVALCACACDRKAEQPAAAPAPAPPGVALSTQAPVSKPPAVVPMPASQGDLDRMILAGYTPHMDHLHSPGVNECPLSKGTEAVM